MRGFAEQFRHAVHRIAEAAQPGGQIREYPGIVAPGSVRGVAGGEVLGGELR